MRFKKNLLLITVVIFTIHCSAGTVDTVSIYSPAMHKVFKCVVIKPNSYKKKKENYPVVYLLHGYQGWYSNWIIRAPELSDYADQYNVLIVCPDGGYSSWYFDSPVDTAMKYETYIGTEVPAYIDDHYRTVKDRSGRAITGLSMGGHGALFIAFRHSGMFGACGSMSGGVDLYASKNKFDIGKRLGDTIQYAANWKQNSVINLIEHYPKDSLAITFDCGVNDELFAEANKKLHEKMLQLKIPHDYAERPGKHAWSYWRNSIQYHLLFFRNYFNAQKWAQGRGK
jgi:S-formylglutathione hydrolase FrmB